MEKSQLFKRLKPDILHINNGGYPGAFSCRPSVIAARLTGVKKILFIVNNVPQPYNCLNRWMQYPIDRFVLRYVDYFITASKYANDKLAEYLKVPRTKLINIPNTIIPKKIVSGREETKKRFALKNSDVVFGNVSLLEKRKGHIYLIRAFHLLSSEEG